MNLSSATHSNPKPTYQNPQLPTSKPTQIRQAKHPRRTIIINRRPNNTYCRPSQTIFRAAPQTTVSPPPEGYPVRNQPLHDVGLDLTVHQHLSRPPRSTCLDLTIPAPIASHLARPLTSRATSTDRTKDSFLYISFLFFFFLMNLLLFF